MAMRVSDRGIAEILSHEALVTHPYRDSVGVWTIAVGHTAGAGAPNPATMPKGVGLSIEECIEIFRTDLPKYEKGVNDAIKVPLEQHEFDALVSFHYNTGAIARAGLTRLINQGDKAQAANAFMVWSKPPEIIGRRTHEMKLFRDGKYSNDGKCTVYPANANGNVLWNQGKRVNVATLLGQSAPAKPKKKIETTAKQEAVAITTPATGGVVAEGVARQVEKMPPASGDAQTTLEGLQSTIQPYAASGLRIFAYICGAITILIAAYAVWKYGKQLFGILRDWWRGEA